MSDDTILSSVNQNNIMTSIDSNVAAFRTRMQDLYYQDMGKLFRESIMSDVTLVVTNDDGSENEDGKKSHSVSFPVHKCILCARCDYFNNMFKYEWSEAHSQVVHITDKEPEDFRVLLDYFYTARLNIHSENAFGVLKLADEFGIDIVREHCINYVREVVNNENVFDVLEESMYHNFEELVQFCKIYVDNHAKELLFGENFWRVDKSTLIDILKSDNIMASEIEIFIAILQWGKQQVKHKNSSSDKDSTVNQNTRRKKRTKNMLSKKRKINTNRINHNSTHIANSNPGIDISSPSSPSSVNLQHKRKTTGDVSEDNSNNMSRSYDATSYSSYLSTSEALGRSPSSRGKRVLRRRGLSIAAEPSDSHLSLSEITEYFEQTASESELTDLTTFDDEEPDEMLATEEQIGDFNEDDINPPRQLSNLLNLTITSSASVLEPMSHVASSPTPFQLPDSSQLKKTFANLLDYTNDKTFTKELASMVADLMEYVRFPILDPHELYDLVEPSLIVPKTLLLEAYRCHALSPRLDVVKSPRMKVREGSLFYRSDVLENVPIKLLKGWTCIYQQPYSHATSAAVFDAVKGSRILLAARHKNSSRLALCAMGHVSKVLRETKENETTFENGVYFYYWKGRSVGFSSSDNINLGTADLAGGSKKLSWHLTGRGGYRCGELTRLNDSREWEKLVFYAR